MTINRRSWHYRYLWLFVGREGKMPENLCRYFWLLVASLTIFPCLLLLVSPIILLLVGVMAGADALRSRRGLRPPSLVGEWVRAKKQRICPLITYVEETR